MTCSLQRAPKNGQVLLGEPCEKPLATQAHLVTCGVGPGRMRAHRGVQHALCAELRKAGAEVDLERVVPELSGRARPQRDGGRPFAILDLFVTVPGIRSALWWTFRSVRHMRPDIVILR